MSGMKNGEYIQRDVHNLARFISVMKFKASTWKTTHPFIVADRYILFFSQYFQQLILLEWKISLNLN